MKILLDEMNTIFISFSMAKKQAFEKNGTDEFTEDDLPFFFHIYLNKMNEIFKEYGEIIICKEGYNSLGWRKEVYPDYKGNREKAKDQAYQVLKKSLPTLDELMKLYPTKSIKVEGAEADDSIYALSTYFAEQGENVLVISSDGDLVQLSNIDEKIKVYNPIRREMAKIKPNIIKYKAIVGDRSDNIPGLYRVGEKTFEKMLVDSELWDAKVNTESNKKTYENFTKIVDLSMYPKEYHEEAIRQFNEQEWNTFNPGGIEYFMFENKLNDHLARWGNDSAEIIESLRDIESITDKEKKEFEEILEASEKAKETTLEEALSDIDTFLEDLI